MLTQYTQTQTHTQSFKQTNKKMTLYNSVEISSWAITFLLKLSKCLTGHQNPR